MRWLGDFMCDITKHDQIKKGDVITIDGVGATAKGDMIMRKRQDCPPPPFWGINIRTGKRGRAIKLFKFIAT